MFRMPSSKCVGPMAFCGHTSRHFSQCRQLPQSFTSSWPPGGRKSVLLGTIFAPAPTATSAQAPTAPKAKVRRVKPTLCSRFSAGAFFSSAIYSSPSFSLSSSPSARRSRKNSPSLCKKPRVMRPTPR